MFCVNWDALNLPWPSIFIGGGLVIEGLVKNLPNLFLEVEIRVGYNTYRSDWCHLLVRLVRPVVGQVRLVGVRPVCPTGLTG